MKKKNILVIGSGWGGFMLCRKLLKSNLFNVSCVSKRNHFLFTPLLASTTTGTLDTRTVMEPVRTLPGVRFYQGELNNVDLDKKEVHCTSAFDATHDFSLPFDRLVLGFGADAQTFGIKDLKKHVRFLKEIVDARAIRRELLRQLERASEPGLSEEQRRALLRIVICGGGPTSVEFSGELYDFLQQDIRKAYPNVADLLSVTLVEASDTVLSTFQKSLSQFVMRKLDQHGVRLRLQARVREVEHDRLRLDDGEEIPFALCVWSTGVAPRPVVRGLPLRKARSGRILVDDFFRASRDGDSGAVLPDVFAIGDCAVPVHDDLPPTAQVASSEAKHLADNLIRQAKSQPPKPFRFVNKGMLAYVGSYEGVFDARRPVKGFLAWIIWRGAYLTNLVSIRNKMLIPMHWFKSWAFGRDTSFVEKI